MVLARSTARSFSGCALSTTASDSVPSKKVTVMRLAPATTCRLVRMVPLSTMTTPVPTPRSTRAVASLLVAAVVALGHQADDAHHRRQDRLVGARGGRGERLLLDRLAHRRVDLLHRQRRLGAPGAGLDHQNARDQRAAGRQRPEAPLVAQRAAAQRARCGARRGGRRRGRRRAAGGPPARPRLGGRRERL